ncbi:MAG: outer membrane lipoprotein chaperone LolA [Gammaproteobacteria bacterium]
MIRTLLISLLYLGSLAVFAEDLQGRFAKLQTWQADFVQTLSNKDTETDITSEGTLWLLRPDRFRLEYQQPYRQVYVADGERLWFFDEDLEQVTVKPQGDSLDQTPAMILSQPARLAASYEISSHTQGAGVLYALRPRSTESGFERIEILFQNDRLSEMHMYDHFAQRTSLRFKNIQSNHNIPAQRFRFVPPAGVDVIGERE